jgi:thymidylate synthase (FAD)
MTKEEALSTSIPVLDHGFVRLIDVMGDDSAIVQAARVSYGKGTKSVNEDRGLIRFLMRHRHTSPFEMVEFKFLVKLPIFIARQWIRHRTANVNEYSGRYSEMTNEFYLPDPDMIRPQSQTNKQCRADEPIESDKAELILDKLAFAQKKLYSDYTEYLDLGLAREVARINLPLSAYTEWYWKIDLHNLFHFLSLRLDPTAQYEIRVYAETITEMIRPFVPLAMSAFEDFRLNAMSFSARELEMLAQLLPSADPDETVFSQSEISKGELREFFEKIKSIKELKK